MAMSNSIVRAQDIMLCQLCKFDPKLKWKCIDCGLLMCSRCTEEVHSKLKHSKEHTIIDIKELGLIGTPKDFEINNVKCKTHAGQTCCLYCCPCKILVCIVCVANNHAGHEFKEIKNITTEDIEDTIKRLQYISVSRATKLQLKVRRVFTTKMGACHEMQTGMNGSLWIFQNISLPSLSVLQNVKPQKQKLRKLITIDTIKIWDFRILSAGDILIADKTSTLKIINSKTGKKTDSKFYMKHLLITAVHVANDDKVLVAARSTEAAFPVSGRRVVIMMDNEARKEAEWEYDKNNEQIFSCPRILTCSKNGTIFVVDYVSSDCNGRIVVLNRNGGVVNTYVGHPDINSDENSFQPDCLINAPSDNFIVRDMKTNILHYLDNSGNFLSVFDTTTIHIDHPSCLTFVNRETMFIGCTTSKDSTDKAKLYELEFAETE